MTDLDQDPAMSDLSDALAVLADTLDRVDDAKSSIKRRTKAQIQAEEQADLTLYGGGEPTVAAYRAATEALTTAFKLASLSFEADPATPVEPPTSSDAAPYDVPTEGTPTPDKLDAVLSQAAAQLAEVETALAATDTMAQDTPAPVVWARCRAQGAITHARRVLSAATGGWYPEATRCELAAQALTAARTAFQRVEQVAETRERVRADRT